MTGNERKTNVQVYLVDIFLTYFYTAVFHILTPVSVSLSLELNTGTFVLRFRVKVIFFLLNTTSPNCYFFGSLHWISHCKNLDCCIIAVSLGFLIVLGTFYILFHFTLVQLSVQCRTHLNAEIDALAFQYCNIVFVISHFALFCFPLLSNDVLIGDNNNPI